MTSDIPVTRRIFEGKSEMAKGLMGRDDQRDVMLLAPCAYCKHCIEWGQQFTEKGWTCTAYPKGIPKSIWSRRKKHDIVFMGQEGVDVYESIVEVFDDGPHVISFEGDWSPVKQ